MRLHNQSAPLSITFVALAVLALTASFAAAAGPATSGPVGDKPTSEECSLLDDARTRGKMDGLLVYLARKCGREDLIGQVRQSAAVVSESGEGPGIPDVMVNDPTGDTQHTSTTQSETAISRNEANGTYCSGYNDAHSGLGSDNSFTGFSRSTDGGATWSDQGALPSPSSGDPSIVWRRSDGKFYFAALRSGGLGIWRSDDDCQTFTFVSQIVSGSDDKEIMAVDNNVASPFYGRLYVAWTDFGAGSQIYEVHSDDGGATWSGQVALSAAGVDVQGAWPAVAPNGDVFVGWVRWNPWVSSGNTTMDIEIARSTDGGGTWAQVTNPLTGAQHPSDSAASSGFCGRPALNGNIRYLPSPQIAVGPDSALHAVYSYDPDAYNSGDVVNVYYRRSTDSGATWGTEIRLNDDATLADQYFPTLSVGPENIVVATWYDRRLDPANFNQDTYKSFSPDGGVTWVPNIRVSDVSSPIVLDPGLATCYHGDYDQNAQDTGFALLQWSDDRRFDAVLGRNDPDVWFELEPVSNDFLLVANPSEQSACLPPSVVYGIEVLQFQGFSEPVTLAAVGEPAGTTIDFTPNPVVPGNPSTFTLGNTAAAAPGSYVIDVTGTSAPSAIVHDVQVGLDLFVAVPSAPALTAPTNGAMNQPTRPTLVWVASPEALTYTVEIATDAGFGNIVDSAVGLTEATYTPTTDLATNTEHFWRVRAENACGAGPDSPVWSFFTAPEPGDCAVGATPNQLWFDDLEGGAAGWTHGGPGDTWALSGARTHSGANAWLGIDVPTNSDQLLDTPAIVLPTGEAPVSLKFWHWQEIESNGPGCYDGGVVEITTDGGATWTRLEAELLTDPYDGVVDNCCNNPIQDENAWCADPDVDWVRAIVDLDAFAGETVRLRFRLATDDSVGREGWYLDDVEVQSCPAGDQIFADGFETGDISAWSGSSLP